jgi:hypothetical protein
MASRRLEDCGNEAVETTSKIPVNQCGRLAAQQAVQSKNA